MSVKKTESKYGKRVFKIEVTAIYNEDMEASQIADELSAGLYDSLKKSGKRLAVMNVDSVKVPSKPDDVVMKIIGNLSDKNEDAMSMRGTGNEKCVVVGEEAATKPEKPKKAAMKSGRKTKNEKRA